MTEARAIDLCLKHRDPAGFEFLVKQYRREAYFHALGFMGNAPDAADACQEAFARAFASMPRLDALTHFYPWFYRILRNYCFNTLARRKTARDNAQRMEHEIVFGAPETDVSVLAQQGAEQKLVWRALGHLSIEFREILLLKYIEDCSYEEISSRLGIARGTVMSRLYYARKAFKDAFARLENGKEAGNGNM